MPAKPSDRRLLYLLHRASQVAIRHVNARLAERAVSVAQLGTLSYLAQRPGSSLTDLATVLDLNKSAITTMCARLERAGLLRREPNPHEARSARLFSTAKGERMREGSRPVFRAVMREMTEGFSRDELDVVARFLGAVVERFGSEEAR